MMGTEPIRMVDLELQLSSDADGARLKAIREELEAELSSTKRRTDAGLPPDEFDVARRWNEGLKAAISAVERFWKQENK